MQHTCFYSVIVRNNLLRTISYNLLMFICLNAISFAYMTHICCKVRCSNELLITATRKYNIRKRKLRISAVLKYEHILFTPTINKNIFVRNILFIFILQSCTKKRPVGRFIRLYNYSIVLDNMCIRESPWLSS